MSVVFGGMSDTDSPLCRRQSQSIAVVFISYEVLRFTQKLIRNYKNDPFLQVQGCLLRQD
jgi:hypothetical protein